MSNSRPRPTYGGGPLPSLKEIVGEPWNTYDDNQESLVLPPIINPRASPPSKHPTRPPDPGYWPEKPPPQRPPLLTRSPFESNEREEEEEEIAEADQDGSKDGSDDEPVPSQSRFQSNSRPPGGYWPEKAPPQRPPQISHNLFASDEQEEGEEEEEEEEDVEHDGSKGGEDDDELGPNILLTRPSQSKSRSNSRSLDPGYWPERDPSQRAPQISHNLSESNEHEQEEAVVEMEQDARENGDEPGSCPPPSTGPSQSKPPSNPNLLSVSDTRPILRLSPKALAEGGPELEAQQYTLLHQYRLPSSSSTDEPTSAPPAYVYQTPTAPQPSSGPVPFTFNVLRAQQGDLVNVRTPSVRAQGILRPTAIIEDEDESHKRYKCDWPDCGKKYDRPSSLEVHKHSHTRTQPFPCPEPGCSRAFSVKSNMLRHFRSHPRRAGMSAAEVSAASSRKAASIAAANEKADSTTSSREKSREKEREKNKETDQDRENGSDKDKSRTSTISSSRPPILTITPAPSTSVSTSTAYPATRARTALASALASLESTLTSTPEPVAPASSSAGAAAVPVPPLISPPPSPLLSPYSPHSTYSSAPTSASATSTGLLSPSFTSASVSTSASFSPPSSELLSPHSTYSSNSPYSMQSPHSPAASTSSEREKEQEQERHASGSPVYGDRDHEQDSRRRSKSPLPIPILVTTPNHTSSSLPSQRPSSSSISRSPSPLSPQFGRQALFPVSNARGSTSSLEGTDRTTRTSKHCTSPSFSTPKTRKRDNHSVYRHTSPLPRLVHSPVQRDEMRRELGSPPRVTSPNRISSQPPSSETSLGSRHTNKEKGKEIDGNNTEKRVNSSYWPPLPERSKAFHKTIDEGMDSESGTTLSPEAPPRTTSPRLLPPSPGLDSITTQSDSRSRPMLRVDEHKPQRQEKGFWPTELPSQKRKFHSLLPEDVGDESEEENGGDETAEDTEDMETEAAAGKKKGPSHAGGFLGLKPGLGKLMEKQREGAANDRLNDFELNKSRRKEPEIQSYMDVDPSECASLSGPEDDMSAGFSIRAGLGALTRLESE